jgi:hypothetical protein
VTERCNRARKAAARPTAYSEGAEAAALRQPQGPPTGAPPLPTRRLTRVSTILIPIGVSPQKRLRHPKVGAPSPKSNFAAFSGMGHEANSEFHASPLPGGQEHAARIAMLVGTAQHVPTDMRTLAVRYLAPSCPARRQLGFRGAATVSRFDLSATSDHASSGHCRRSRNRRYGISTGQRIGLTPP